MFTSPLLELLASRDVRKLSCLSAIFLLCFLTLPSSAGSSFKMVVKVKGKVETKLASSDKWKPVFSSRLLKDGQNH